jgi:uncharacterized damage-inducible protein DinB
MSQIDALINEFEHEAQTTRKHLERLPEDELGWRPHEKSFTAGALASHIVDCVRWSDSILTTDELDMDPATYKPYDAASVPDLLKTFDDEVAKCGQLLKSVTDEMLTQPWTVKVNGQSFFTKPKSAAFRDIVLSHLIHHRGQFSVYLRLLNVPVPGSYGPSADEPFDM